MAYLANKDKKEGLIRPEGREGKKPAEYNLKPTLMDKREYSLYLELKKQLVEHFNIMSKVRLEDFIGVNRRGVPSNKVFGRRGKIKSRHVDFLICDNNLKPVMAIELDGSSHHSQRAQEHDAFINSLYHEVGLHWSE